MLLVDSRAGSKDLLTPLQRLGLPAEMTELAFGDVAFTGRGIGGKPVDIGIEYKQFGECVASMQSGRLQGHQAPGLQDTYDFRWLLVEGEILFDSQGMVQRRCGRRNLKPLPGHMSISEYWKRLNVLHLCWGLNPAHTLTTPMTLKWIEALYRTWTDADLDKHKSHLAIYEPPRLVPLSNFRRAICKWPGIGIRTSAVLETAFQGSLRLASNAPADVWARIQVPDDKGKLRKFGESRARAVVNFLEGV